MYVITRKDRKGTEVYLRRIIDIPFYRDYLFSYDIERAIYYHRSSDASAVLARYRIPKARVTPLIEPDDTIYVSLHSNAKL